MAYLWIITGLWMYPTMCLYNSSGLPNRKVPNVQPHIINSIAILYVLVCRSHK